MAPLNNLSTDDQLTSLNNIFVTHQAELLMQAGLLISNVMSCEHYADCILQLNHSLSQLKRYSESPQLIETEIYQAKVTQVKEEFNVLLAHSDGNDAHIPSVMADNVFTVNRKLDESITLQQALGRLRAQATEPAQYSHQQGPFSCISSSSRDAYMTCDDNGRIVSANNGAQQMFGSTARALANSHITELFDKTDHYWLKQEFEHIEMKGIRADSSGVSTDVSRYLLQPGESRYSCLVVRDITSYKLFEDTMQQAMADAESSNQAKSEFISAMSHELRTPLNAILGFAQLLEIDRVDQLSEDQARFVKHIRDGGKHLLNLINDILDLAKIEAGKVAIQKEQMVLADLVAKSVLLVEKQAQERGIQIYTTVSTAATLPVYSDDTRLTQVLLNLLSNAVKYNRENGRIRIDQHLIDQHTVGIYISDTGPGIALSKRHQLFRPFNRLGAEATNIEGTGIGLSVAKKIMALLGGRINFKSEEGAGSTFWIELPLVKAAEPQTKERYQHEVHTQSEDIHNSIYSELKGKLLYIEDQQDNRSLFEALISQFDGLDLLLAKDAESGIILAQREVPDVIILDINLPGIDGYQALAQLRELKETVNIPAIALTASAMPCDIERGLEAGFSHYMTKPIQVEELVSVLEFLLHR